MEKFLEFIKENLYPIIGLAVAIILLLTGFYEVIIGIVIIVICVYAGFYFKNNKEDVKEKLKNLIDKL